ncbi:hypothetical protein [Glutamicibacter sp. PS]|nr:hypothetical protein [Glutamicibacter sp. PS]
MPEPPTRERNDPAPTPAQFEAEWELANWSNDHPEVMDVKYLNW